MRINKTVAYSAAVALVGVTVAVVTSSADAAPAPAAAQVPAYGMGLDITSIRQNRGLAAPAETAQPVFAAAAAAAVPESFDLSQYALPPGNQGQVGSCVTWATGYTGYGILMKEQGIAGAPMAPMFIYAQISKGNDRGTSASVALPMEQRQGIDTKAHYSHGDFDYTTQPNAAERANAAKYKLSGFNELPTSGSAAKTAIKKAISQGMPVPIGVQIHKSFMNVSSTKAANYSYLPGSRASDPIVGGHEITVIGYEARGVKIENSWGTSWGARGFITVPWSFFDTGDVMEIHAMGKLVK
ncbi:C1 family peptidase [Actinokineospora sp. NBRC 105648]|uniref:C1 family peptidase n=1 Tax=Actinokineospora sp. NBRC 105648 TaxID=3032206 RepID=UPI0024A5D133|nr:C1 family peptidase [Actinokineospora sp. NBRC 105648]GLZ43351.1 peptidase C1 [Actinokineospora sp. NBRC 105648]